MLVGIEKIWAAEFSRVWPNIIDNKPFELRQFRPKLAWNRQDLAKLAQSVGPESTTFGSNIDQSRRNLAKHRELGTEFDHVPPNVANLDQHRQEQTPEKCPHFALGINRLGTNSGQLRPNMTPESTVCGPTTRTHPTWAEASSSYLISASHSPAPM